MIIFNWWLQRQHTVLHETKKVCYGLFYQKFTFEITAIFGTKKNVKGSLKDNKCTKMKDVKITM